MAGKPPCGLYNRPNWSPSSCSTWTTVPVGLLSHLRRAASTAGPVLCDLHKPAYLNGVEKLKFMYCSYANGVIAYGREIARSERYLVPIKHARIVRIGRSQGLSSS